ncbi:hypothetical protein AEAC466_13600 [Asticcacaulis sp. AC466]|nr:hypothetical protein AEAC466_13600 [Asticcacaulis sp. AC466]
MAFFEILSEPTDLPDLLLSGPEMCCCCFI